MAVETLPIPQERSHQPEWLRRNYPAEHFEVLPKAEALFDFIFHADRAQDRILLEAMHKEVGHFEGLMHNSILKAAERGVGVRLHVDEYTNITSDGHHPIIPIWRAGLRNYLRVKKGINSFSFDEIEEAGGHTVFTNPPKSFWEDKFPTQQFPIKGRNHIKIWVVDDVGWIGGMNLSDANFETEDFMVKIEDPEMVEALVQQFGRVNKDRLKEDSVIFDNGTSKILVDCGKPNSSLVLDTATDLAKSAKIKAACVSQFMPDPTIFKALHQAFENGGVGEFLTTSKQGGITSLMSFANLAASLYSYYNKVFIYTFPESLHAKLLLVDGKTAMFGSHNFVDRGVKLGTEEIAMVSSDPTLVANLMEYYNRLVQKATLFYDPFWPNRK